MRGRAKGKRVGGPLCAFLGGENSAWIKDGLLVTKGNPLFFFQNLSFFRYAAPRARSATHERSENKAGGILRWEKSFDCVLNIDPCLSCSTS